MANTFKAAFSAVCGMVDVIGPTAKYTDEVFDQSTLPEGLEIAVLLNPFHDHKMEHYINDYFIPKKNSQIFMDSGGFQLIKGIFKGDKTAFKEKVYGLMSKYADYGFCFDENPLGENRIYEHDKVIPAVRETSKNIKRQIEVFKEKNAKAKVFAIFQVKEDDRVEAADIMFDGIDMSHIAGIAFNSLVWGGSGTADFGKLAFFNELKKSHNAPNFIHLLSYGELKIVTPFIVLQRFGWLGDDNIISVDSSSYTMGLRRWGYIPWMDGSAKRVCAAVNPPVWEAFRDYCVARCPELKEKIAHKDHNNTKGPACDANLMSTCYMMVAKDAYKELFKDPIAFGLKHNYLNEAQIVSLKALSKTTSFDDFKKWRNEYEFLWNTRRKASDSKEQVKNTLDAFF